MNILKQFIILCLKDNSKSLSYKKKWSFRYHDNTNILGIISFCVIFGVIMRSEIKIIVINRNEIPIFLFNFSNMGRKAEILLHLFLVFNEIIMRLVMMVMW